MFVPLWGGLAHNNQSTHRHAARFRFMPHVYCEGSSAPRAETIKEKNKSRARCPAVPKAVVPLRRLEDLSVLLWTLAFGHPSASLATGIMEQGAGAVLPAHPGSNF